MCKFEIFKSIFMNRKNRKGNDLHNKVYFDTFIVGRVNCFDKIL